MAALAPHDAWENLSATWRLDSSNARGRHKCHLAFESWQKARLAKAAQLPRGARATQAPYGTFHCYYNIITYN